MYGANSKFVRDTRRGVRYYVYMPFSLAENKSDCLLDELVRMSCYDESHTAAGRKTKNAAK